MNACTVSWKLGALCRCIIPIYFVFPGMRGTSIAASDLWLPGLASLQRLRGKCEGWSFAQRRGEGGGSTELSRPYFTGIENGLAGGGLLPPLMLYDFMVGGATDDSELEGCCRRR